jgi:2-polyprenyl-6-methoxyphenol hydroxylase-like FAD-dependent oxidoreductase
MSEGAGRREHAVVIGGSVAGMLAARVLADHFDRVTLIERDSFPVEPVFRAGVPQGRHLHVLWTRGLEIVNDLFPGLEEDLLAAGAPDIRIPGDFLWLTSAGWRTRFDVTRMVTFSRGLLDWTIRQRIHADKRIEVVTGQEVTGFLSHKDRVQGVEFRDRTTHATAEPLTADLVVDASGRGSRAPEWLARLGRPFPKETKIDPLLGYASRYYAIPDGFDPGWKALYIQAQPPGSKRTGGLFPQEGGRWICSLSGAGRDYPPTSEDGFLNYAKNLRSPVLYDAIRNAEPLTPITSFRRTANHRRHYEKMKSWPEGFAAIGDSVCTFNPIYGQGMSVAALSALALDRALRENRDMLWFQKRAARAASGAWLVATGEDRRYAETEGPPVRLDTKIINAYVDRVVRAANVDPIACSALLDVLALKQGPTSLFRPATLARVLTNRKHASAAPTELPARQLTT